MEITFLHGFSKVLLEKKTQPNLPSVQWSSHNGNYLSAWHFVKKYVRISQQFFCTLKSACLHLFYYKILRSSKKNHKYLWETTTINQQANFTGPYGILASKIMEFSWNWDIEGMEMTFLSLGFFTCRKQYESLCIFFRYLETNLWFKCIIKNITFG